MSSAEVVDDAWTLSLLMLDGLSQRVEIAADSIAHTVADHREMLAVELAATRQDLRDAGDVRGRSRFYSEVIQRSAEIAVSASAPDPVPRGLQQTPVPEPETEPEPELDTDAVLQRLLSPAGMPTPQRALQVTRSFRRFPHATAPSSRATFGGKEAASAARRRRGSPEALAAATRRRQAAGLRMDAEVALVRDHLANASLGADDSGPDEGEPPAMAKGRHAVADDHQQGSTTLHRGDGPLDDRGLVEWFRARNLSSVAALVCSGLGLHRTEDLSSVTPDALTKLALANAKHPQLNPLRLRRLKDALQEETRSAGFPCSAGLGWAAWSPPPAFDRGAYALAAIGLHATGRDVSDTRQILARNTLTQVEAGRVAREERALLEHARRQWCKRGEERGQTAHNALSARRKPGDVHSAIEVTSPWSK